MRTRIFISLIITLLFVSCTKRSETTTNIVQENNEKMEKCTMIFENEIDEVLEMFIDENFEEFFEKFKTDSVFQVSRIIFPLEINIFEFGVIWVDDNWVDVEGITTITRNINDFRFLNFSYYKEGDFLSDVLLETTELSENEISVNYRVWETGIYTDFTFRKDKNNKWHLVQIDDRGN